MFNQQAGGVLRPNFARPNDENEGLTRGALKVKQNVLPPTATATNVGGLTQRSALAPLVANRTANVSATSRTRFGQQQQKSTTYDNSGLAPMAIDSHPLAKPQQQYTQLAKLLLLAPGDMTENTIDPVNEVDREDMDDPQAVTEFVVDINDYLFSIEPHYMADANYMSRQGELVWKHRSILVDWIVQVHHRFKLLPETLFLAINFLDRYLSKRSVSRDRLQLVGLASLLVACKYEEIYPPPISDFVYVSDNFYQKGDILEMERQILYVLDYELGTPNCLHFLRRASKAENYDLHTRTLGKYFMEMTLLDEVFLKYTPSQIGTASIWLARLMLKRGPWNPTMSTYTGYRESQILLCVEEMMTTLMRPTKLTSIQKKYASQRFLKASIYAEQMLEKAGIKSPGTASSFLQSENTNAGNAGSTLTLGSQGTSGFE